MDKKDDPEQRLIPTGGSELINASSLISRGLNLAKNMSSLTNYKASILIVDDDPDILDVLDLTLSEFYKVRMCPNGAEVLEELKENHYDLLITDIPMPIMHGLELIKRVNELKPSLPIMVLTGSTKWLARAIKLGCVAYFQKPFNPSKLLDVVAKILSQEYRATDEEIIIQLYTDPS